MSVHTEIFGQLPDGRPVHRYRLKQGAAELCLIDYGAILTEWHLPDRTGQLGDVFLGMPALEDYLGAHPYYGALVGRVAGRVTGGRFKMDGRTLELPRNEGAHHLHGGRVGFDQRLWTLRDQGSDASGAWVVLQVESAEGDQGYPGNLEAELTYTLTPELCLRVELTAHCDAPTPFAPTQHAYFNLSAGGEATVAAHRLSIDADWYLPTDASYGFLGRIDPVVAGRNDLRSPCQLGTIMRDRLETHGDMYVLHAERREHPVVVAEVEHPASGRRIQVATTEPCLQLYTGKFLDSETGRTKSGKAYPAYAGLCLECQGYPSSPLPGLAASVLQPETTFRMVTGAIKSAG